MGDAAKLVRRCMTAYDWPELFAHRAVNEYKRWMRLKAASDDEMLPSDQVWIVELQDTREYQRNEGCDLIHTFIHRDPPEFVPDELREEQYARTLAVYSRTFRALPPADIWPGAEFASAESPPVVERRKRGRVAAENVDRPISTESRRKLMRAETTPSLNSIFADSDMMTVFGRGNGRTVTMLVRPTDLGARLKSLFLLKESGHPEGLRAVHQSRPLLMDRSLQEQGITKDATIDFVYTHSRRVSIP